jgi:hypothetical protein
MDFYFTNQKVKKRGYSLQRCGGEFGMVSTALESSKAAGK